MKFAAGFLAAVILLIAVLMLLPGPDERVILYDCGMAEWHPDIPNEVKEACRKQRREAKQGITI